MWPSNQNLAIGAANAIELGVSFVPLNLGTSRLDWGGSAAVVCGAKDERNQRIFARSEEGIPVLSVRRNHQGVKGTGEVGEQVRLQPTSVITTVLD